MKTLLTRIQAALTGVLTGLRDRDIVIIPDAGVLPPDTRLPCIGIKDGRTIYHELAGDTLEKEMPVEVYLYDRLTRDRDCVLEFLDNAELVFSRLKGNLLSGYVRDASPSSATPVFLLYSEKGPILRKGYFFEYDTQEE